MATSGTGTLAEKLAAFVVGFDLRSSPDRDALVEKAKLHVLDGIGVALAAPTMEDGYAGKLLQAVNAWGSSSECTMIGFRERAAPPLAAFMNGSLIHGCELDDAYYERMVHPESFAVPVALATAEHRGLGGYEVMEGFLIAAEVAVRLARGCNESVTPGDSGSLNSSGFHTTSIFGTIGAAAAAAKLLGLAADQVATAMSLAVSFTSGTTQGWSDGGGRNKPIQPGWAAMSGLMAAQMARAGYECSHSTLDGRRGLFAAHAWKNGWGVDPVLEDIGRTWKCQDVAFKLYPAGAMVHSVIECTRQLVFEHDIQPEEVESVDVILPSQYAHQLEPQRIKARYRPTTGYGATGSWPCNVARMILSREVGLQHLTLKAVREPAMLALADKVICKAGTDVSVAAEERPTRVVIKTGRGVFERSRKKSVGNSDEVKREEIVEKFHRNARLGISTAKADAIRKSVLGLDQADDLGSMTKLLGPQP